MAQVQREKLLRHGRRDVINISLGLVYRPRPARLEQPRQSSVGEDHPAGLAAGAVIGLVLGIHDALHWRPADRAWSAEATMHRHLRSECGHFLWKITTRVRAQSFGPLGEHYARGLVESLDLRGRQFSSHGDWRESRTTEDLVGVGVADPTEESRVGKRTLERVVLLQQSPLTSGSI